MKPTPDFIADLTYHTTDQGGRSTPALSGYRPHIKFAFSEYQTSGQQKFIDKAVVYPGDTVTAEISIIAVDVFQNKLKEGLKFEFREGHKIIGTGIITKVLNQILHKTDATH